MTDKRKIKQTTMAEDFVMAGSAAVLSKTVAAPIERIKLLLQNQSESAAITSEYRGIIDILRRVPTEQGMLSFWRGNTSNCIRYFPTQALNIMFKNKYKQIFGRSRSDGFWPALVGNVMSGGAAGATSLLFVYPLDFARTRLAMDVGRGVNREFTGTLDCLRKTTVKGGFFTRTGVYQGFGVSVLGIMAYRGAYFGVYDTLSQTGPFQEAGFAKKLALGYGVTVAAGWISYPIDSVRRRLQMTSGGAKKYKNALDCTQQIYASEGIRGFYRGAGSNILRGLCGALVLVGFDYSKEYYLRLKNELLEDSEDEN